MSGEFIGTYKCMACSKRVRVYDWLPQMILCSGCTRDEARREAKDKRDAPVQPDEGRSSPDVYMGDTRLAQAMADLDGDEFIARHNYACCQTCGVTMIVSEANERQQKPSWYAFWHEQDEDGRARRGDVYLAYGSVGSAPATEAGERIVAHFAKRGIRCEWSGSPTSRIKVIGSDLGPNE